MGRRLLLAPGDVVRKVLDLIRLMKADPPHHVTDRYHPLQLPGIEDRQMAAALVGHYLHRFLAKVLEIPMNRVRVIKPYVGGGFGGKSDPFPHEMIISHLSKKLGQPVQIRFNREEVFAAVQDFFRERYRHMMLRSGYESDPIVAVISVSFDRICGLRSKIDQLKKFASESEEFQPLTLTFKRVTNILKKQKQNTDDKRDVLREMKNFVPKLEKHLENSKLDLLGKLLHENWLLKKSLVGTISNPEIDNMYNKAMDAGALGGKICGAGGGGSGDLRRRRADLRPPDRRSAASTARRRRPEGTH